MDPQAQTRFSDPVVISGFGAFRGKPQEAVSEINNEQLKTITALLKNPKMKKFMGKQDKMAVIAAHSAVQQANIPKEAFRENTGLFLSVGFIPFEYSDIEPLARHSAEDGKFSMERFSTEGISQVNPLLTFRCLPNMPIFHVSLNLGIQGPSFTTYPGIGQFYLALQEATEMLQNNTIQFALVGGVADQNNFLVQHHFQKTQPFLEKQLVDSAGFICLEKLSSARSRAHQALFEQIYLDIQYPVPLFEQEQPTSHQEYLSYSDQRLSWEAFGYLGPGSFPIFLSALEPDLSHFEHQANTLDRFQIQSQWKKILSS